MEYVIIFAYSSKLVARQLWVKMVSAHQDSLMGHDLKLYGVAFIQAVLFYSRKDSG